MTSAAAPRAPSALCSAASTAACSRSLRPARVQVCILQHTCLPDVLNSDVSEMQRDFMQLRIDGQREPHCAWRHCMLTFHLRAGVAAGFNAPISGVFFAVESVLQRPGAKDEFGDLMDSSAAANSSGLTIAMVLLSSVVAAVVSQVS